MNAFVQPAVIMSRLPKMIHGVGNLSFQKVLSLQGFCISGHLLKQRDKSQPPAFYPTVQLPMHENDLQRLFSDLNYFKSTL